MMKWMMNLMKVQYYRTGDNNVEAQLPILNSTDSDPALEKSDAGVAGSGVDLQLIHHDDNKDDISKLLVGILGEVEIVQQFIQIKNKMEKWPSEPMYRQTFGYITAQLEIKLGGAEDKIRRQLNELENQRLSNGMSIEIPKGGKDYELYVDLVEQLRIIHFLKMNFEGSV